MFRLFYFGLLNFVLSFSYYRFLRVTFFSSFNMQLYKKFFFNALTGFNCIPAAFQNMDQEERY